MSEPPRYEVGLADAATEDLRAIAQYIRDHGSANVAEAVIDRVLERIALLEVFPMRGSEPKELQGKNPGGIRQIVTGPDRIFYRVAGQQVPVSLIADGRRDMTKLVAERLAST